MEAELIIQVVDGIPEIYLAFGEDVPWYVVEFLYSHKNDMESPVVIFYDDDGICLYDEEEYEFFYLC